MATGGLSMQGNSTLEKSQPELMTLKKDDDLKHAEVVIVVMGPTGAGKSRLIREASMEDVPVGDSLVSDTPQVQAYHFTNHGQRVAIVDTPGFDDTYRPDTAVFRELAAWLVARYQEETRLTAIVWVQRITDSRVSGGVLRNLAVMKRMIGIQNFPHLTMVTTMWDTVDPDLGKMRETELKSKFWADLLDSGANVARFSGDQESALAIVNTINNRQNLPLTIAQEIVDNKLNLDQTTAGSYLERELLNNSSADANELRHILAEQRELKASWNPHYGSLWLEYQQDSAPTWDPKIYDSLSVNEFRLVEIRAGRTPSPLDISISTENLQKAPRYSALSYAVGQDQASVGVDLRHGRVLYDYEIAENLYIALMHLRRSNTDILLWVDALCINPTDHKERAQQIRCMNQIFSGADNVCIWLGPSEGDSKKDQAMRLAKEVLNLQKLDALIANPDLSDDFWALASLTASTWFSRRWCVQEILMAKSATVHCGDHVLSWSDFVDVVDLLRSRWHLIDENQDEKVRHRVGHVHHIGASALIETSRSVVRQGGEGDVIERLLDLETLLTTLAIFEVTLAHDAVYAVHALASDLRGSNAIRIDYSLEPRELFGDVTEFIVRKSGSLDVICRPWAPPAGLPSWIPLASRLPHIRRRHGWQYDRQNGDILASLPNQIKRYRACGHHSARGNVSFTKGAQPILSARGMHVAVVGEVGGECVGGTIPSSWLLLGGWENIHAELVPEMFWRTLVADQGPDSERAPGWYSRACELSFRESRNPFFDTKSLQDCVESSHAREFLQKAQDMTWSRNLASVTSQFSPSQTHTLCLCPGATKPGDILCILYGLSVPVILRQQGAYHVLVGECFVCGLMDGEAVKLTPKASEETFKII